MNAHLIDVRSLQTESQEKVRVTLLLLRGHRSEVQVLALGKVERGPSNRLEVPQNKNSA